MPALPRGRPDSKAMRPVTQIDLFMIFLALIVGFGIQAVAIRELGIRVKALESQQKAKP